jgi:hypothetical protein
MVNSLTEFSICISQILNQLATALSDAKGEFMSAVAIEKEKAPAMALKAVIIFDSRALAARAIAALENAATTVGESIQWDIKSWRAAELKRADMAGVTVAAAIDADLIVLALDKTRNASDELLDWLEHWSEHRHVEDAAIMAFCPEESSPAFLKELKWFAEWRGLNFVESREAVPPKNVVQLGHSLPPESQIMGEPVLPAATAGE